MAWESQGRQYHMWFGHGTTPKEETESAPPSSEGLFAPLSVGQRIDYAAASVVGHVPQLERRRWESSLGQIARERLRTVIATWYGAAGLSRDSFRERLLDPYTSDEAVDRFRSAAQGSVEARTHEELGAAGADLAAAIQKIGFERWPGYLAEADRRAIGAASDGTIPNIVKASAAGADAATAGAVLLGGIMLYLTLKSLEPGAKPGTPRATPPAPPAQPLIVEAAVPLPPPKEDETPADVLKPGGRLVGQPGSSAGVRELPGGEQSAEELFDRLTKGGTDITPSRYPGKRVRLPNGDTIGYRPKSTSGPPTIDVDVAGVGIDKLKFPTR